MNPMLPMATPTVARRTLTAGFPGRNRDAGVAPMITIPFRRCFALSRRRGDDDVKLGGGGATRENATSTSPSADASANLGRRVGFYGSVGSGRA